MTRFVVSQTRESISRSRRFNAMRRIHYLSFLSLLFPAFFLLSGCATVEAQQSPSAKASNWSNPATWPDKKVPGKDAAVAIGKDMNVILDVSPPALRSLTIEGKL